MTCVALSVESETASRSRWKSAIVPTPSPPDSRVEADWNHKLRALTDAQAHDARQRQADRGTLDDTQRQEILRLATDFPAIWQDPRTPPRERKRMAALLLEDVTLLRREQLTLHVRFRGGTTTTLTLPLPQNAWQRRTTRPEVLAALDALLDQHTDAEVATVLNERGMRTGAGIAFSAHRVKWLRAAKGVPSLRQRLRARHWLTANELAAKLGVAYDTVKVWRRHGRLHASRCNDKGEWLYDPATQDPRASDSESARFPVVAEGTCHPASVAGGAV